MFFFFSSKYYSVFIIFWGWFNFCGYFLFMNFNFLKLYCYKILDIYKDYVYELRLEINEN